MGSLKAVHGYAFELTTTSLQGERWWLALRTIVSLLREVGVVEVDVEFGFVVERDLEGLEQGVDTRVAIDELEAFIQRGLLEGTIERSAGSDFCLHAAGTHIGVMLCNDDDIHIGADDAAMLNSFAGVLHSAGLETFGPFPEPQPNETDR